MLNEIKAYTFFRSYHDSLKSLNPEDKRVLLEAIDDYVFEDIEPELNGFMNGIWTLLKPNLDSSKNHSKHYQNKIKKKSNENQIEVSDNDLTGNKNKDKNKKKNKNKNENKNKELDKEFILSNEDYDEAILDWLGEVDNES